MQRNLIFSPTKFPNLLTLQGSLNGKSTLSPGLIIYKDFPFSVNFESRNADRYDRFGALQRSFKKHSNFFNILKSLEISLQFLYFKKTFI